MNDKKTVDELKKLQQRARAINVDIVRFMHNRCFVENIAIAETRIENFVEDMDIVISDLAGVHSPGR